MTVSVGLSVDPQHPEWLELAREAERVGVDSIWVPEFWAYDAFTPLAAIAARTERVRLATGIAQLGARTPAMLAMSAMSLQHISGGRFVLGIGTSGPQVMEGWHGVEFSRPVRRTRETIEIIRLITAGERLTYAGEVYQLPLPGSEGAAIRSRAGACFVPIYIAALGPANLALTGSPANNFYNNAFARQGFGDDVAAVQRLWSQGDREAAAARVPIEIGLGTNLIGPPDVVRDRLRAYRDCGVTTLRVNPIGNGLRECIEGLEVLLNLANDVNGEVERDAVS